MRLSLACVAFVLVASAAPAHAAHVAGPSTLSGTWQEVVPVVMTSYTPSSADPTTGRYDGVGSTLWQGTWTGVTHYDIHGTADLVTGAGSGTLQETFVGRSSDGGTGSLSFNESYTVDPTGALTIVAHLVGGTGDFTGAHGWVTFTGMQDSIVTGNGTYAGRWSHR